jgi:hypothetical protein
MKTGPRYCWHCHNISQHNVVFVFPSVRLWDEPGHIYAQDTSLIEPFNYYLAECSTCHDVSLLGAWASDIPERLVDYELLYPQIYELPKSVPQTLQTAYSEALHLRRVSANAFAGQIRKALEYLCQDKNATGKNLFQQLNALSQAGVLPPTLLELADIIRVIGNAGVHAGDDEVSESDVEIIDDFFRLVIEYVYVAPASLDQIKKKMLKAQSE